MTHDPQTEAKMTMSETIVIGLIWALTIPGLFFGIRKAWRRHRARQRQEKG